MIILENGAPELSQYETRRYAITTTMCTHMTFWRAGGAGATMPVIETDNGYKARIPDNLIANYGYIEASATISDGNGSADVVDTGRFYVRENAIPENYAPDDYESPVYQGLYALIRSMQSRMDAGEFIGETGPVGPQGDPAPADLVVPAVNAYIAEYLRLHPEATIDEDIIRSAVNAWLANHPEYVTTVMDNSISAAKLTAAVRENVEAVPGLKQDLTKLDTKLSESYFYPDGAGKNKCNPLRNVAGRLNNNGGIDSISGIYTSDFIEIAEGETYVVSATPTSGISYNRVAFYSDKATVIKFVTSGTTAVEIPAEAKYVRVSNYYSQQIQAFFVGFGETYDGWEAYEIGEIHADRLPNNLSPENIKAEIDNAVALQFPIKPENTTFFTFEKSSNLLSTQDCEVGRLKTNGDIDTTATTYKTTAFVDIHRNDGKNLIQQYNKTALGSNGYAFYRQNKEFLSGYAYSSNAAVVIPDGAYFFRMSVDYRSKDLLVGISDDTAAIPFEEYRSVKYISTEYVKLSNWYKGKKGAAIGDSITNNATTYTTADGREGSAWRELVASELELTDTIYNCGVGGSKVAGGGSAGNAMWTDGRINAIPVDTDFILFNGGMNDWQSGVVLGNEDSTDTSTFYGALNIIAQKLMQRFPTIPIFFMTTTYGYKPNLTDGKNAINLTLYDYGRAIKATAERYGFPCIDLYALCGMNRHNYTHFLNDESSSEFAGFIHPNRNGGRKITTAICSVVKSYQPCEVD